MHSSSPLFHSFRYFYSPFSTKLDPDWNDRKTPLSHYRIPTPRQAVRADSNSDLIFFQSTWLPISHMALKQSCCVGSQLGLSHINILVNDRADAAAKCPSLL